jgi:hypothetical protein
MGIMFLSDSCDGIIFFRGGSSKIGINLREKIRRIAQDIEIIGIKTQN